MARAELAGANGEREAYLRAKERAMRIRSERRMPLSVKMLYIASAVLVLAGAAMLASPLWAPVLAAGMGMSHLLLAKAVTDTMTFGLISLWAGAIASLIGKDAGKEAGLW